MMVKVQREIVIKAVAAIKGTPLVTSLLGDALDGHASFQCLSEAHRRIVNFTDFTVSGSW